MKSNFESHLKQTAIATVPAFKNFKSNKLKVISNTDKYPNSVTLSMDMYCAPVDGYIFCNAATGDHYAMTATDVSTALTNMISKKKCWKPTGRKADEADLLRLTFDEIGQYKFD